MTWDRVARALASVERTHGDEWYRRFRHVLDNFHFLPGGRVLANAGAGPEEGLGSTLFNCFVMGAIDGDVNSTFESLRESMLTLSGGGGIGCDFSSVPPQRARATGFTHGTRGVVATMRLWDEACAVVMDADLRRGAMMATLRDDHPDIEAFINAKRDGTQCRHFNLSVLVTDKLIRAVDRDEMWPLVFPLRGRTPAAGHKVCRRRWSGHFEDEDCEVIAQIPARQLWEHIMRAAFEAAEPGVIFIDRVRRSNNLAWCEQIDATNPCGEVPLPAYGACNLGSINLTQFVREPFSQRSHFDLPEIAATTVIATRMLDSVYDVSAFPLPSQANVARRSRRVGLGITGLADALAMLGLRYGSDAAIDLAGRVMALISHTAYRASSILARERGSFPAYEEAAYCASAFVAALPGDIVDSIHKHGIRNSHLLSIAPAGSISLLANNVSSGIEPVFSWVTKRRVLDENGVARQWDVADYAWAMFRRLNGEHATAPEAFVTAYEVDPVQQLRMQAALQTHVDNAISKTINVPTNIGFDAFRDLYRTAWSLGLKGCTVSRPNEVTGAVLDTCGDGHRFCMRSTPIASSPP